MAPPTETPNPVSVGGSYDVPALRGGLDGLTVEARFAPTGGPLRVDDEAAPYLRDVRVASGSAWVTVEGHGPSWNVPCTSGCRVRYRYDLRQAAATLDDPETAIGAGEVLVAPPATWLLRPDAVEGRFLFHLAIDHPWRFATAMRRAPGALADTFEAPTQELEDASFAVFGAFEPAAIVRGPMRADVAIAPGLAPLSSADVTGWIEAAVDAIAAYYGRPFVDRVLVVVIPGKAGSPTRGETLGAGGPAVLVRAAGGLTAAALRDDWVVTHELLHASLPTLGHDHAWLSEGIATYVEPIVRSRAGLVTPEAYWRELAEGLPQGLPETGDRGLEQTSTWGRTYWGGAVFCFAADLVIRERTANSRSFDDALRGIVASGADVEEHWSVERFIEAGDRATGTDVLAQLYRSMALAPGTIDLESTWKRLGVRVDASGVTFDDGAPLAAVRRAITERGPIKAD